MIKETESNIMLQKRSSFNPMKRTESVFHSTWLLIKKKDQEMTEKKEEELSKKLQSVKGKPLTMTNKVENANIKNWKEQKWILPAFFENIKMYFKTPNGLQQTYGQAIERPARLPINFNTYEEGDTEYKILKENDKKELDDYGYLMMSEYLKNGLNDEEVKKRHEDYGPNKLPEPKKKPEIIKFLEQLTNVFGLLLWGAMILSFIGYALSPDDMSNLYLGIVIAGIVIITGSISYYQNRKSEVIMESFKSMGIAQCVVVRNGIEVKVPTTELVVGDVVKIHLGEKIPADLRIMISNDLQVDNSPLTGESLPVKISTTCGEKGRHNPIEATNIVFFSTLCKNGNAVGVVIQTGPNTFMGRIADLAINSSGEVTTLQHEIDEFLKLIAIISICFGITFFVLGFIIKYPVVTNFIFAIGIIVANVPEGLITTVTVCLTITAQKMLKRNVMVKNLQAVETLGSITCICSDKTGTLTQNKMTVVHVWMDMQIKKLKESQEDIVYDGQLIDMNVFNPGSATFPYFQFAGICGSKGNFHTETPENFPPFVKERNKYMKDHPKAKVEEIQKEVARLKKKYQPEYNKVYLSDIDERETDTDASETGIMKFFEKIENISIVREKFPMHKDLYTNKDVLIPFNSSLKFTCMLRRVYNSTNPEQYGYWLAMKGAPERILERCSRFMHEGKEYSITEEFKNSFQFANKMFAIKGERVIGVAYTKLDPNIFTMDYHFRNHPQEEFDPDFKYDIPQPNYPITDLCFLGLVAMEDPPRPGVKEAIKQCHNAGIKVIMVTGDQPLTAASIAYQIGIIKDLDDTPEIIKERENLKTLEEAEKKSNTIIITGDRLHHYLKLDEGLSEENPQKGAFLRKWLMKRDVVFARTSPEQKLIIVDGCQKLSHVVAVTGDGVNDSPAIKKADIGIAMGKVGTDVAKDAADILLLDDNFANIVKGIKQGRTIFDTIKKIIVYNLTSNVTELIPFLGFVILQYPLPLTTILILCMDVGTNIYPNISFSFEPHEARIMDRKPRNVKVDKLCNTKLFLWGYLFMGIVMVSAAFLSYFAILHMYGFYPTHLFFFVMDEGASPARQDVFNPYDNKYKGNSYGFIRDNADLLQLNQESYNLMVTYRWRTVDYSSSFDEWIDLRLFFYYFPDNYWSSCALDSIGMNYVGPVCWHVEAIRHAQTGFLTAIVIMQAANAICCRTIAESNLVHLWSNHYLNFAFIVEFGLICILQYVPGLNAAFFLRPLRIECWAPPLGQFIIMILYSEFHKYLMRHVKYPDGSNGFFYEHFYY